MERKEKKPEPPHLLFSYRDYPDMAREAREYERLRALITRNGKSKDEFQKVLESYLQMQPGMEIRVGIRGGELRFGFEQSTSVSYGKLLQEKAPDLLAQHKDQYTMLVPRFYLRR